MVVANRGTVTLSRMETLTPAQILMVACAGGMVGIVSGAFGVGGGFLIFPILTAGLGLPVEIAIGCAACQALGPSTTALLERRVRWGDFDVPLILAGGLLVGILGGGATLNHWKELESGPSGVEHVEWLTNGLYVVLLGSVGAFSLYEGRRSEKHQPVATGWLVGAPLPPRLRSDEIPHPVSLPLLCWFGLAVGFQSALLGNSGGLLMLPGLVYLFGIPTQQAVEYALVSVWLVSLKSTAVHAWYDHVSLPVVAALLLGGTFGAHFGSNWGKRLRSAQTRTRFGWLALGTAAFLVVRLIRLSQA